MFEIAQILGLVAPLLVGFGTFVLKLLPLVSDRVNKRAVRLARARSARK